jgi:hypothetical protein
VLHQWGRPDTARQRFFNEFVVHYCKIEKRLPASKKGRNEQEVELMKRYHPARAVHAAAGAGKLAMTEGQWRSCCYAYP